MKQTIAWIGIINQQEDFLIKVAEHYRVLLVRKEDSPIPDLNQRTGSEVDLIYCVKDGCWEADIIVLSEEEVQEDLLGKIREVATQKIVLVMNSGDSTENVVEEKLSKIRKSLPFSKIVAVIPHSDGTVLFGENPEAVATARGIVSVF